MQQSNLNNNTQINLYSEIDKLKNELNNKNKIIEQQNSTIIKLTNKLNNLNNLYNTNLSLIQNLQNNLNQKEQVLQQLKNKLNTNSNINNTQNKWGFAIKFISTNQEINHHPMICNEKDLISRLEEELYNEYPKYKDYNTYLTCNDIILKRFKTIGENNIKKNDVILVNIMK